MKSKNIFEVIGVALVAMLGFVGFLFLIPLISVGFGYLGGLVIEWIFGGLITKGLNLLFNTTRFTSHLIPILTATLAMVGSYFKSSQTNKK